MSEKASGDILIAEIFGPTIQGEGALIGLPTVFVRTGGCDYRCSWCDSLHAVSSAYRHDWGSMSSEAGLAKSARALAWCSLDRIFVGRQSRHPTFWAHDRAGAQ